MDLRRLEYLLACHLVSPCQNFVKMDQRRDKVSVDCEKAVGARASTILDGLADGILAAEQGRRG